MHEISKILIVLLVLTSFHFAQANVDVCSRTLQVKEELERELKKPCGEISAEDLGRVTYMILNQKGITSLDKLDFSGLVGLQGVFLDSNNLNTLPLGLFDGLPRLRAVAISRNKLASISSDFFDGLDTLEGIYLESNGLKTLPVDLFNGLARVKHLDLSGNELTSLPEGLFNSLPGLQELALESNQLATLPAGIFEALSSLQKLDLNNNKLTTLPVGLFDGLSGLQKLDLHFNQLSSLQQGLFDGLTGLQEIDLSSNKLTIIPDGIFKELSSINSVNLSHNQIKVIEENPFGLKLNPQICHSRNFVNLYLNPINVYPASKLPKTRNPYQCPMMPLGDADNIIDHFFHFTMTRMDSTNFNFTQIEDKVPLLENALIRDYLLMQITAHYGFDLIPTLDGTLEGLYIVRQLAVDVCSLVGSFCPIREQIHAFPRLEHLTATTDLKNSLLAQGASSATVAKVTELEKALLQMFSRDLNYQSIRERLPEGTSKLYLDQLFTQTSWTFTDLAEASQKIQMELTQPQSEDWKAQHFIAFFKIKSFLIYTFKKNFWNQPAQGLYNAKTVHSLVTMSQSVSLLSEREAQYLRIAIDRGDDLKAVIDKAVQWQLKNLEREHFSQANNSAYTPVLPQYPDPKIMLEPLYEKVVRTSMIAEWDRL